MEALFFNVCCQPIRLAHSVFTELLAVLSATSQAQNGFLEGVVRGYRNSLLTSNVYNNLTQCENLEGQSHVFP